MSFAFKLKSFHASENVKTNNGKWKLLWFVPFPSQTMGYKTPLRINKKHSTIFYKNKRRKKENTRKIVDEKLIICDFVFDTWNLFYSCLSIIQCLSINFIDCVASVFNFSSISQMKSLIFTKRNLIIVIGPDWLSIWVILCFSDEAFFTETYSRSGDRQDR